MFKWLILIIFIIFQVCFSFDLSLLEIDYQFNWMEVNPECVNPMQDQGLCDGSYAIAAASILSDRFCIKGKKVKSLSPQYLISCNSNSNRCDGGSMYDAWQGLMEHGLVTNECMPFLGDNKNTPLCPIPLFCIVPSESNEKYLIKGFESISMDKTKVMNEIRKNGPVQAEMNLYEDFLTFKGDGVYRYSHGSLIGRINVKIIGWNLKEDIPYWYMMGPFGKKLGMKGVIKVKFGECGIDDNFIFGIPK